MVGSDTTEHYAIAWQEDIMYCEPDTWVTVYAPEPESCMDDTQWRCWLNCGACGNKACHRELSKAGIPEYRSIARPTKLPFARWVVKGSRI